MRRILTAVALGLCLVCTALRPARTVPNSVRDNFNATVRMDTTEHAVFFVFSADSMFEGADTALRAMADRGIRASFFFTGNFLRMPQNNPVLRRIIDEGHYVGPHSDGHILLADWKRNRPSLVDADSLKRDMHRNLAMLAAHGVDTSAVHTVMPPYEWCNASHVQAYADLGLLTVNPTPEIETYRDYTTPDMSEYRTAESLQKQLFDVDDSRGLNGAIIIIHLGTQNARPDKLYNRLPAILDTLSSRGYSFDRF